MVLKLKTTYTSIPLSLNHTISRDVLCALPSLTDILVSLDKRHSTIIKPSLPKRASQATVLRIYWYKTYGEMTLIVRNSHLMKNLDRINYMQSLYLPSQENHCLFGQGRFEAFL